MSDWRRVESELIAALDAAGIDVRRDRGDVFAVVASLECHYPEKCRAGIGPYGKVECFHCENDQNLNASLTTLDLTKLARRLADLK